MTSRREFAIWFQICAIDRVDCGGFGSKIFAPIVSGQSDVLSDSYFEISADGGARWFDLSDLAYAQKNYSEKISSEGKHGGMTIDDVAKKLEQGEMSPHDISVETVTRDRTLIVNTRSAQALERAGIPRSQWNFVDMTGNPATESRVDAQLRNNRRDRRGIDDVYSRGLLKGARGE